MRKKNLLISGVVLAAASMASYAVLSNPQFVNAIADDDEPTPELTDVTDWTDWNSTIPATDGNVPSTEPVSMIQLVYPANGDDGLSVQRTEGLNIEIKKAGETLYTIPLTDKTQVYCDSKYYNYADIKLPEAISEPGTYEVVVPKDAFLVKEVDADSYKHSDGTTYTNVHAKIYNNAQSFTFNIVKAYSYTVSPAPGSDVLQSELANIKITYDEGADVKILNEDAKIVLNWRQSGKDNEKTTYKATAEGNVVTLSAVDPAKITVQAKGSSKWYHVNIPEGVWEVGGLANTAIDLTPYGVVAFKADLCNPSLSKDADNTIDDILDIKITFPAPVTIGTAFSTTSILKCVTAGETKSTPLKITGVSANGRTITVAPYSDADTPNDAIVKQWLSGDLTLSLAAGSVKNEYGSSNTVLTWTGYKYTSTSTSFGLNSGVNMTYPADGAEFAKAGYDANGVQQFLYKVVPADDSKIVTLSRNGEVIYSWKPSQAYTNAQVTTLIPATGNAGAYFAFTDADGKQINLTPELAGYGKFTMNVPAGAFKAVANPEATNTEISWTYVNRDPATIPQMSIAEGGPVFWNDAKEFPNINGFKSFTVVYPEGCTVKVKNNPPTSFNVMWARTAKFSGVNYDSYMTKKVYNVNFTPEGNKVIVTMDPCPASCEYISYRISLEAGLFTITDKDGEDFVSPKTNIFFRVENPAQGTLQLVEGTASDYTLKPFPTTLTAENISDVLSKFYYLSYDALKTIKEADALPYLENAETGEKVEGVTFTKTKDTDVNITSASGKLEKFVCSGINNITVGKYNFVIPANCLSYGGDALATADNTESGFVNTEAYKFPFEVELGNVPEISEPTVTCATAGVNAEINFNAVWNEINVILVSEDYSVKEAVLNLPIPVGYFSVYAMDFAAMGGGDIESYYVRRADTEGWPTESVILASGAQKVTSLTIPADKKEHEYGLMYGSLGMVNPQTWTLNASFDNTVGVDGILVEGEEAAYYTLQGVRVLNPGEGVYVKVANGKAVKVIRK